MKKIIDGKLHDTETTIEITTLPNLIAGHWIIYKTKKGNYFGHWKSPVFSTDEIKTLSENDAKKILENQDKFDAYVQEFGEPKLA